MLKRLTVLSGLALGCNSGTLDAGRDVPPLNASGSANGTPMDDDEAPEPSTSEPETLEPSTDDAVEPADSDDNDDDLDDGGPIQEPSDPVEAGSGGAPSVVDAGGEDEPPDDDSDPVERLLPVDEGNPILLVNDSPVDNWFGEHALLASSVGRIDLAAIVVNSTDYWSDPEANRMRWQQLIDVARESGLSNLPGLVVGASEPLVQPQSGNIDATASNNSIGAQFIVEAANRFGTVELPLVVITGSTLSDIAGAYLLEPAIAERIVVVSSIGWTSDDGAVIGGPNGELDKWAGVIVTQRLRFVQVSGFYEHSEDVPEARVGELPQNAFGDWMANKRANIDNSYAADQRSLLAVTVPNFALEVRRVGFRGRNAEGEVLLGFDDTGCCWFVPAVDGALAGDYLWELLNIPNMFGP